MNRFSITVSDRTLSDLRYIADRDETSVAQVARDCIRASLPGLVQVTKFIHDPRHTPTEMLAFADQMELTLAMVAGAAGVAEGDEAAPPRRKYRHQPNKPPSSNTGVNPPQGTL